MTTPYDPRTPQPPYEDAPTLVQPPLQPAAPPAARPPQPGQLGQLGQAPARRQGVSRRAVIIGAAGAAVGVGAVGAGAGFALSHLTGSAGIQNVFASDAGKVIHLLRRAGFGPSPADISGYLSLGVTGALDQLINYSSVSNDVDQRLASFNFDFTNRADLIRWWLARMVLTQRPLEEKMTLFWHGVLTSSFAKIGKSANLPLMIQQNQLLRTHAMGRFDDLIAAISTDPAMLYWLDGRFNAGARPNENYSRELMELFTLGIGNYTQDDVHNGAKALSGWVIRGGKGVFAPRRFYQGTITYLNHTGHLGLSDVVSILCAHPATPGHLARLMWSFFVYDNPSQSDVQPLIDAYTKSNHQISAMVTAMFNAPAFFSAKAYRARVKSPAEFVVGAARSMGFTPNVAALTVMGQAMIAMGQTLFDPPNVAGWPGDKLSSNWMSTQAWLSRINFVNELLAAASGALRGRYAGASASTSALQAIITAQKLAKPDDVVNYFVALLLDNQLGGDRRTALLEALTMDAASVSAAATLTLSGGATLSAAAVRQALYLLMSMPEYLMN